MEFEWDQPKNQTNIRKHGIGFETAKRIFEGPVATSPDHRRDYGEDRNISIGRVEPGALIVVAHTERHGRIRWSPPAPHRARKGWPTMSGRYDSPLAPEQIAAVKDEDIDFSDIAELDEDFWKRAELVEPDRTDQITIRVKRSVLAYFKAPGKGYQTRMNRVLESYVRHRMGDSASTGEGAGG